MWKAAAAGETQKFREGMGWDKVESEAEVARALAFEVWGSWTWLVCL